MIQNEKLVAVGRLASSIAHEINNPMEAVTNLVYLAQYAADLKEAQSYLINAESELRRMSAITSHTLRFHKQSTRPVQATCTELISSVVGIYETRLTNSDIAVETRKRAERPVLCFEGDVRQVLSNLVGNAIDAMQARGGRLLLRSRVGHDWKTGRPGLVITVADTGSGMLPQVLNKVFEAFFTTKGIGVISDD